MSAPVLTIDGPSGVGKGTVARVVAQQQGWNLLDSGAIYRAFALAVESRGVDIADENALEEIAKNLDLAFKTHEDSELVSVYLDGRDVSKILRTEKTGEKASKIASIGVVRAALLKRQQDFSTSPGLVADGRDMGSVVFKNAAYKVYLTASSEERANRRLKQLQAQGHQGIMSQILAEVEARDERDSSRKHSPLKPAKDALVIDTTELSLDEVIAQVSELVKA
ncbi:Cytidylate kinase [Bathymodiolus heckerae thiotrophic gill symbiont]|uniref:(d)CMP kinase n=1 Tax=Bathymodiolus heckerae thiotrophic gill symbiont TaxID=1052212 RepID=UPI0010B8AC3D|nr:(d)CMP kinase [Bathymodiolus heckerae thiotrophic gill symbiont]CAC9533357.1 Cytidylate kinase (EC 2.7.4.25) [uncultured Gammaproteobacteria bacterium]SHN91429.1 Cytidylate kinase [Bathymodiolus heckerae thiotrophic gill symbiont]